MKKIIIAVSILLSATTGSSVFAFDMKDIEIHGFLSQGYLKSDHNNYLAETEDGTFQFNEFGVNFSKSLTNDLRVGIQFMGRDLGPERNDEIVVDWAFMDYRLKDWMGFRFGKFRAVYGLYNETREADMLRIPVMLPQSVYPELWRDNFANVKGMAVYGHIPAGIAGSLEYDVQVGVLSLDAEGGFSRSFEDSLSALKLDVTSMDSDYLTTMSLIWNTPVDGLRTRITSYDVHGMELHGSVSGVLPYDLNKDGVISPGEGLPVKTMDYQVMTIRGYIASIEYTYGDFVIAAEYAEGDFSGRINLGYGYTERPPFPQTGWYVTAGYRFNPLFSAALTYSDFIPNMYDENGAMQVANGKNDFQAWLRTWTLSTRFDITSNWLVKLEASYNDGFGAYDPMKNNPSDLDQYWWLFAAKATVRF